MKKFLSGLLSLVMVLSLTTTAFATDITIAGSDSEVPVELTQAASEFSVTVPTVLPVDVDADGVVTVATDNKIINNSWGPVEVKGVEVQPQNDWVLQEFTTDFKTKNVGIKEFGFQLNNTNVEVDGGCAAEFEVIEGNSEISFTYDANVATQKQSLEDVQIAYVVFTMGWHRDTYVIEVYQAGPNITGTLYSDRTLVVEGSGALPQYDTYASGGIDYRAPWVSAYREAYVKNGYYSDEYQNFITTVIIRGDITVLTKYAFFNINSIKKIIIEKSDTPMYIERGAFYANHGLEEIYIPKNVTVGPYFIEGGISFGTLYYEGTESEWYEARNHYLAYYDIKSVTEVFNYTYEEE